MRNNKQIRCPHRHLLRSRKAQVQETQLNWIFILIVGAIIMAFFTVVVIKQKASSEAKFAGKVTQQLNTILVGAKVSSGTVQMIPTPELEIRFSCNDYYIGPASQRLGNRVVFAPEFIEGDELITWALDWNVPFKVSTFLYMTTPFIRYVIVAMTPGTYGKAVELYEALPDKMNRLLVNISDIDSVIDEHDKHVRFIFVTASDSAVSFPVPQNFDEEAALSGLIVRLSTPLKVQFLKRQSAGFALQAPDEFTCLEDKILFGAIFSDKYDTYKCLMKRAYRRLNVVADIYRTRLNLMSPSYKYTACEGMYWENPNMKLIIGATTQSLIETDNVDYGSLAEAKMTLIDDNTRLQLRSCALIY